ncbi:MAG TPA: hypothetical protein VFQ41_03205 [Candidatus Angelobacter sp.]|nr:hypothetical protein [Candidatus Angelobacter sp.]
MLAAFFATSRTAVAMCVAGGAVIVVGTWAARKDLVAARGLDKIVALANLCFAAPLAVFGMLHLFAPDFVKGLVPRYMPGRMFWVYFVGCALIAASLSIAAKIGVRWSGLLVGIMMFMFVAMLYLPSGLRHMHALANAVTANIAYPEEGKGLARFTWTIVFRESSFGAAAWLLAATAANGWRGPVKSTMIVVGRTVIALAAIFFGIQHFPHHLGLPGVPLQKEMPVWVPARAIIDYVTGAALLACGLSVLLNWKTRIVAASVGAWILLLIVVIYGPVMISALGSPALEVKVEGINYFADTLLFAGVILALASAAPRSTARQQ